MSTPATSTQEWYAATITALFVLLIFSPPVTTLFDAVLRWLCLPSYCSKNNCLSVFGLLCNTIAVLLFVRFAPLT